MPHFFATMFMAIFMAQIDISGGFWGSLFQGLRRAKVVPQVGLKNAITVSLEEYFRRHRFSVHRFPWIDGFNKPWMERLKELVNFHSSTLKTRNFEWKLVFQPLSARVHVNLLEGNRWYCNSHLYYGDIW